MGVWKRVTGRQWWGITKSVPSCCLAREAEGTPSVRLARLASKRGRQTQRCRCFKTTVAPIFDQYIHMGHSVCFGILEVLMPLLKQSPSLIIPDNTSTPPPLYWCPSHLRFPRQQGHAIQRFWRKKKKRGDLRLIVHIIAVQRKTGISTEHFRLFLPCVACVHSSLANDVVGIYSDWLKTSIGWCVKRLSIAHPKHQRAYFWIGSHSPI